MTTHIDPPWADRVLITGGSGFPDSKPLREVLDSGLVYRLPNVTLLTIRGPDLPTLVASSAGRAA